jgi:hypothetical protein
MYSNISEPDQTERSLRSISRTFWFNFPGSNPSLQCSTPPFFRKSSSTRKSKEICVHVNASRTREEEEKIVNQSMTSLKTDLAKPKISESPVYKERYLTHQPHPSRLHTSFGHISAFNLTDLSVVNVVRNPFETFLTNWLNVRQICNCLSDLGTVARSQSRLRDDYSFLSLARKSVYAVECFWTKWDLHVRRSLFLSKVFNHFPELWKLVALTKIELPKIERTRDFMGEKALRWNDPSNFLFGSFNSSGFIDRPTSRGWEVKWMEMSSLLPSCSIQPKIWQIDVIIFYKTNLLCLSLTINQKRAYPWFASRSLRCDCHVYYGTLERSPYSLKIVISHRSAFETVLKYWGVPHRPIQIHKMSECNDFLPLRKSETP